MGACIAHRRNAFEGEVIVASGFTVTCVRRRQVPDTLVAV